jgi:pimeloyl-ACP methyl ester carboxylesterase
MNRPHAHQAVERRRLRQAARRQALAAVFLTFFSMVSPAPDLRPKPNLPVRYQMVKPADPPDFGFDGIASGDEPPVPDTTASSAVETAELARAGLPAYHPFRSEQAKVTYLALYDGRARDWPVPCESIRVLGAFGQTHVRVSGPADAPPLVLLHGISSNSLAWMPNVAALARSHRVYAVDHIEDGGRSIATRPLANLDDHLTWLDGLFDGLGLVKGVNLVGLSYGGWLAAQYAVARPQRLRKLVLLAPAGTVLPLASEWLVRAVACAIPLRFFTHSFLSWLLRDLAQRPASERPAFDDIVTEAYTTLRCLAPHAMVPPTVLSDQELNRLAVPALYLVGENEKICAPWQALQRLRAVAPGITTRLITGAGHDLTLVKAAEVNRAVLEFLT